jgi:hypothetical protein
MDVLQQQSGKYHNSQPYEIRQVRQTVFFRVGFTELPCLFSPAQGINRAVAFFRACLDLNSFVMLETECGREQQVRNVGSQFV